MNPNDTTPGFWDCNCNSDYIFPKWIDQCPVCNAHRDDEGQPDSFISEIYDRIREAEALWLIMQGYSSRISINQFCWVVYNAETPALTERWEVYRHDPWKEPQLAFQGKSLMDVLRFLYQKGELDPLKE